MSTHDTRPWWGEFTTPPGHTRRWRIGPLNLWAERRAHEWRMYHHSSGDPLASDLMIDKKASFPTPEELDGMAGPAGSVLAGASAGTPGRVMRAGGQQIDTLSLLPALADRSVVARPEDPFCILAGSEGTFYVSTVVWLTVRLGGASNGSERGKDRHASWQTVLDVSTCRPADTWFGPSTREGTLSYALQTKLRRDIDNLPRLPHRAITQVTLRNRASEQLSVERFNVPVPELALYSNAKGHLWTPVVELDRRSSGEVEIRMDRGLPEIAGPLELVSEARRSASRNLLVRALGSLLD